MVRAIAVVTGANGGVGYGICERLLLQLSRPDPPDMMPQPHVDPSFSVSSLDSAPKITPFDSLTIILACRNRSRAIEARDKLLVFVDAELNKRRIQTGGGEEGEYLHAYGQRFRSKLELDFIPCDLASAGSVLQFCETVQQRYPYITHIFCNAGVGAFDGVEWFGAIKHILRNPIEAVTYPTYKIQRKGVLSEDGFGWVWQCNVLGHYLMVGTILPLDGNICTNPLEISLPFRFAISRNPFRPVHPLHFLLVPSGPPLWISSLRYLTDLSRIGN